MSEVRNSIDTVWTKQSINALRCALMVLIIYYLAGDNLYLITGLIVLGFSYFIPFRTVEAHEDYFWDLTGYACSIFFYRIYSGAVETPIISGILQIESIQALHSWAAGQTLLILLPGYLIIGDFMGYWGHRLLHSRTLWASHAWHHSPKYLNWLSGSRGSLLHIMIVELPYALVVLVFPAPMIASVYWPLKAFEFLNQHYLHSNVRFPYQNRLECVLMTPRCHFVHHSPNIKHTNSNYGFVFTVWDRMFGTFVNPESVDKNEPLGLDYEIDNWRMIIGLPKPRSKVSQRKN